MRACLKGKLQTSEGRKAATVGKFANMESQARMRMVHPDTLISEDATGVATGIHEDGIAWLKALTAHDLTQIKRLRIDVVRKTASSKAVLKDFDKLIKELIIDGQDGQANIIKSFAGYIVKQYEGKGTKDDKDLHGLGDIFDEKMGRKTSKKDNE